MGRGTHRGFVTFDELNKSLGKRNLSDENLEQAFMHILDENVALVEKKSDFKVLRKKENSSKEEGKTIEKSDDPIRMYLASIDWFLFYPFFFFLTSFRAEFVPISSSSCITSQCTL